MQALFSSGGREDPGHSRLQVDFLEVFFHFMKLWAEQVHAFIENLLLSYWEFMFLTGDGLYKWCNCITWCLCGCIQACSYLLFFSCRIEVSALHFLKLCLVCCWSCQHINWRKKIHKYSSLSEIIHQNMLTCHHHQCDPYSLNQCLVLTLNWYSFNCRSLLDWITKKKEASYLMA